MIFVLLMEERSSGVGVSSSFKDWVECNGHIDLGYIWSCYTWLDGTTIKTRKAARFDRALSCDEWRR